MNEYRTSAVITTDTPHFDDFTRYALPALLIGALFTAPALARDIVFDTQTGLVRVNGDPVTSMSDGGFYLPVLDAASGIQRWYLPGNLTIGSSDRVSATGQYGVSLFVGNNATIAPGAVFDFSAVNADPDSGIEAVPGPGGGAGGNGGFSVNGGPGGGGGGGGDGGDGGTPGPGGTLSTLYFGNSGGNGGYGSAGSSGGPGIDGGIGLAGEPGGVGINNTFGAASGGGQRGGVGTGAPKDLSGLGHGIPGLGGIGGVGALLVAGPGTGGTGGWTGGNATSPGGDGGDGLPGKNGNAARHGGTAELISGGNGGGGGGQGSGGGGAAGGIGGTGGGGGAGGGGGGGVPGIPFITPDRTGGRGGSGGPGGQGARGGNGGPGGAGGAGGDGGAGGGAFEIVAHGRLSIAGVFMATGGDGQVGSNGQNGSNPGTLATQAGFGENGDAGRDTGGTELGCAFGGPGSQGAIFGATGGTCLLELGSSGGGGGGGGAGGLGSNGGTGGDGGNGGGAGGGSGGTIKFKATAVVAGDASVDTRGGDNGASAARGDDGRFLFGSNTPGGIPAVLQDAQQSTFVGTRRINPFIAGGTTETPFIPDLQGGAEGFGLLTNPDTQLSLFDDGRGFMSVMRFDDLIGSGLGGLDLDFVGFDVILLANLTAGTTIADPKFGFGGNDLGDVFDLLLGGWTRDPAYLLSGGTGPVELEELAPGEIYALLVPELAGAVGFWSDQGSVFDTDFSVGETAIVPLPAAAWLLLSAFGFGLTVMRRRKL